MTTDPQTDRRERYATAISKWHRDPEQPLYVQAADAVMAIADAEKAAVLRAAADVTKGADAELLHRIADQTQYGDDAEMAASYRRDGFGPDEITELLRPQTPA